MLAFLWSIRYNIRDKVEECPVCPRSDRTSMGPERTIGVRFPRCMLQTGSGPDRPGVPAKCAIVGMDQHGARTIRVLVCSASIHVRTIPQRGFLKDKGGMTGGIRMRTPTGVYRSCKLFRYPGKMPETCPKFFVYALAIERMQCYNNLTFI